MKLIVLTPIKNEAWILDNFLKNTSWADAVFIADQSSSDASINIATSYPQVHLIKNPYEGHSNKVRWLLLDEMRKKFPDDEILAFCLDADEYISEVARLETVKHAEDFFTKLKQNAQDSSVPTYEYPWIQLYGSFETYRIDGVWAHNKRAIAFVDSPKIASRPDYNRIPVINDHTERVPLTSTSSRITITDPVLHLQFLGVKRTAIKQAWYMCQELLSGKNPKRINLQYSPSLSKGKVQTTTIDKKWLAGISLPEADIFSKTDEIRLREIYTLFQEKGLTFFEPLDIWDIDELSSVFIDDTKRKPRPIKYSPISIYIYKILPKSILQAIKKFLN